MGPGRPIRLHQPSALTPAGRAMPSPPVLSAISSAALAAGAGGATAVAWPILCPELISTTETGPTSHGRAAASATATARPFAHSARHLGHRPSRSAASAPSGSAKPPRPSRAPVRPHRSWAGPRRWRPAANTPLLFPDTSPTWQRRQGRSGRGRGWIERRRYIGRPALMSCRMGAVAVVDIGRTLRLALPSHIGAVSVRWGRACRAADAAAWPVGSRRRGPLYQANGISWGHPGPCPGKAAFGERCAV